MILFKACPRCGGDVDATHPDDVSCVQCAHRPTAVLPGPRVADNRNMVPTMHHQTVRPQVNSMDALVKCPRCGSEEIVKLEKVRHHDNTCYRCRMCGHIFSPQAEKEPGQSTIALP